MKITAIPLPLDACLRRSGYAQAGARGEGDNQVIFYAILNS